MARVVDIVDFCRLLISEFYRLIIGPNALHLELLHLKNCLEVEKKQSILFENTYCLKMWFLLCFEFLNILKSVYFKD